MCGASTQKSASFIKLEDFVKSLNEVCRKPVKSLSDGYAETVEDLWENIIEPLLPPVDKASEWYKNLMEYVRILFPILQPLSRSSLPGLSDYNEGCVRLCPYRVHLPPSAGDRLSPFFLPRHRRLQAWGGAVSIRCSWGGYRCGGCNRRGLKRRRVQ